MYSLASRSFCLCSLRAHPHRLMRTGYLRVINNEDLYPIEDEMSSTVLNDQAQRAWIRADKFKPRALIWTTMRASLLSFCSGIFPRICLVGFRYAQPFLLSRTVNFANNPNDPDAVGWALTGAFGLVFMGMAVIYGMYCMYTLHKFKFMFYAFYN